MKKIIVLPCTLILILLCSCSSTNENNLGTVDDIYNQFEKAKAEKENQADKKELKKTDDNKTESTSKNSNKKHFTKIGKSAILNERFTYTDYFSDTKSIQISNTENKLHVWGSVKAEKGAFEFVIQNPEGKKVFKKIYNNPRMTTIDLNFPAIKGEWTFNVTCYNTKGEYQILAEQL